MGLKILGPGPGPRTESLDGQESAVCHTYGITRGPLSTSVLRSKECVVRRVTGLCYRNGPGRGRTGRDRVLVEAGVMGLRR